jgi:hypothetical protein
MSGFCQNQMGGAGFRGLSLPNLGFSSPCHLVWQIIRAKPPVLLWKSANFLILQCGRRENGRIGGHRLGKWPRRVEIYQHSL